MRRANLYDLQEAGFFLRFAGLSVWRTLVSYSYHAFSVGHLSMSLFLCHAHLSKEKKLSEDTELWVWYRNYVLERYSKTVSTTASLMVLQAHRCVTVIIRASRPSRCILGSQSTYVVRYASLLELIASKQLSISSGGHYSGYLDQISNRTRSSL